MSKINIEFHVDLPAVLATELGHAGKVVAVVSITPDGDYYVATSAPNDEILGLFAVAPAEVERQFLAPKK